MTWRTRSTRAHGKCALAARGADECLAAIGNELADGDDIIRRFEGPPFRVLISSHGRLGGAAWAIIGCAMAAERASVSLGVSPVSRRLRRSLAPANR